MHDTTTTAPTETVAWVADCNSNIPGVASVDVDDIGETTIVFDDGRAIVACDTDDAVGTWKFFHDVDDIVRDEPYDATFNTDIADLSDDIMAMAAEA